MRRHRSYDRPRFGIGDENVGIRCDVLTGIGKPSAQLRTLTEVLDGVGRI